MKTMKIATLVALLTAIIFNGCRKSDNNVFVQQHDQNTMMKTMHQMMDSMNMMQMTNDPNIDFAMMMKMHHQGAINMAQIELSKGGDATIKNMAQNIINSQTQEIQQLNNFLAAHMSPSSIDSSFTMESEKIMDNMGREADIQIINGNTDQDFATLMILHHNSAVEMARLYQLHGADASLLSMAKNIVESQQEEIKEFQNWLIPYRKK